MFEERNIKVMDEDLLQQQTYIPIHTQFIDNTTNCSDLILNYSVKITEAVKYPNSYNGFIGLKENMEKLPIFVKYCPLSDPLKIMIGKTEYSDFTLPDVGVDEHIFADKNNSAYVDSFFSYLLQHVIFNSLCNV